MFQQRKVRIVNTHIVCDGPVDERLKRRIWQDYIGYFGARGQLCATIAGTKKDLADKARLLELPS